MVVQSSGSADTRPTTMGENCPISLILGVSLGEHCPNSLLRTPGCRRTCRTGGNRAPGVTSGSGKGAIGHDRPMAVKQRRDDPEDDVRPPGFGRGGTRAL